MSINLPFHPEWYAKHRNRQLNQALHDGDADFLKANYLEKTLVETNPTDGATIFQARKKMTTYENDVRPYVRHWVDQLMQSPLIIDEGYSDAYKMFLKQVTGRQSMRTLSSFIAEDFAAQAFVQGNPSILIEAPAIPPGGVSQGNEEWYLPYLTVVPADALTYWETNSAGEYTECHIESHDTVINASGDAERVVLKMVYKLQGESVSVRKYRLLPNGKNVWEEVGRLPDIPQSFVPLFTFRVDDWVSSELTGRLVALFNKRSHLDAGLAQTGFGQRYMTTNKGRTSILDGSIWGILKLSQGETYDQLQPVDPVAIKERIAGLEQTVRQIALKRVRMISQESRAIESSDTLREQNSGMNAAMRVVSDALGPYLSNVLRHVAEFHGKPWISDEVIAEFQPPTQEDTGALGRFAQIPMAFPNEWAQSPTLRKTVVSRILSSADLELNENDMREVLGELGYGTDQREPT
jgi:hypothetical protein